MASSVPLGITLLSELDSVLIQQKATILQNKYDVMDSIGNVILYAKENSDALNLLFGGKDRSFHIDIYDTDDIKIMSLRRPFTFGADKMEVTVCGTLTSIVRKQVTFFKPVLHINDPSDSLMFKVKGPFATSGECDFDIFTSDKKRLGVISKKWRGFARELFLGSDKFEIRFPRELNARYKAAFIGTCFLIDFLYYE